MRLRLRSNQYMLIITQTEALSKQGHKPISQFKFEHDTHKIRQKWREKRAFLYKNRKNSHHRAALEGRSCCLTSQKKRRIIPNVLRV